MNTNTLPTDQLKKYGILDEDLSFSKKLNADDIQKFLKGYTIVADNDKSRATFQLTDNNTQLKVIFLERDKNLREILENSKDRVEYTDIQKLSNKLSQEFSELEKKAFIFDKETNKILEFDFIKNAIELTAIIADKKNTDELNRYKAELLKLKSLLQDKIDQFPEMTKEITNDLNIVSKEIATVGLISENQSQSQRQERTDVQLNLNDSDLYQDANRMGEETDEQEEEIQKAKGFGR